jgi:hypothetical protein
MKWSLWRVVLLVAAVTSLNCASRRVNQFAAFAEAGRLYSEAVNELTIEAGNAAIDADSAVLLASRESLSEMERLQALKEHKETLQPLLTVLFDLRKQTILLRRYFVVLAQLASDDAPSGIAERASGLVGELQTIGPGLKSAKIGDAEISSFVDAAVPVVVGHFQAKALESHLRAHSNTLEQQLEIQRAVVAALAESTTSHLEIVIQQSETEIVARPYVTGGQLPGDWADRRRESITASVTIQSVDRAVSASEELKRLFIALAENKETGTSFDELLADINAVLDFVELVRSTS